MKKCLVFFLFVMTALESNAAQGEKTVDGFDGGMMIHTGYVKGGFPQANYPFSGTPFGIGGVIRVHIGKHWRIGSEGYVSTLGQLNNGSYVKYGWGGVLGDFHWRLGRFIPYAGLTVGGGVNTNLLIMGETQEKWKPVENTYYNKQGFFALDPFLGCDFIVSEAFHLTLKADWLSCINKTCKIPSGPRLYLGFIFYHR